MAFEHFSRISLNYDKNTRERESMCYETVLIFHIWLKEIFSNSICLGSVENKDEGAAVLILAVIVTGEHVDSQKVF